MTARPPVVVLAGVRWGFLWQRHQTLATLFAEAGYPTVFVETTGLSNPRLTRKSLREVFSRARSSLSRPLAGTGTERVGGEGPVIYSPLTLPPTNAVFRWINAKMLSPRVAREVRGLVDEPPVVIAYPPTRTTLDVIFGLEPRLVLYDCSDEYREFPGVPGDIASTERELLRVADLVSCTSTRLLERVRRSRPDAFLSGPAVDYDLFAPLRKEKPSGGPPVACFFGDLRPERIDPHVLEAIAGSGFEVRVVGEGGGVLRGSGVDFRAAVAHRDLPPALAGVDVFVLPYRVNGLTRSISPAKTYECLATGKPIIASPIPAMEDLGEKYVYLARRPEDYVEVMKNLNALETEEKVRARCEAARRNSWEARFSQLEEELWKKLADDTGSGEWGVGSGKETGRRGFRAPEPPVEFSESPSDGRAKVPEKRQSRTTLLPTHQASDSERLTTPCSSQRVDILGVGVDPLTVEELHERIKGFVRADERAVVLNANAHCLNLVYRDEELRRYFRRAEVVFCDGAGVRVAARILGRKMPERITYADWIRDLCRLAQDEGFSLYFLGGRPGVARRAAEKLRETYPSLKISGVHHGYFDKSGAENTAVVAEINAAEPDILLVGMGMPRQERWLMENRDALRARVALTGGAVFDYVSGELRRGPRLLTDNGFEWLARLAIEPKRLWRRYVIGNPLFVVRVLRQALRRNKAVFEMAAPFRKPRR